MVVKNFLFHRVNPERDPLWDPMDPLLFEKTIRFINDNYKVVLLEDLVSGKCHNSEFPFATIVFDDGYKDNIEYALPILDKYNIKASFYVVTDSIENNVPTWTYILDYRFLKTSKTNIELPPVLKLDGLNSADLPYEKDRIQFVKRLKPLLKKLMHSERSILLDAVNSQFDDVEIPKIMMNWDDLRTLYAGGHYIGSHTVRHSMLGTVEDDALLNFELIQSAQQIQSELGYFPSTISYPVGSYNKKVIEQSKKAGYKYGLAVDQESYNPQEDDIYAIPRIELYNEPWMKTKLRINGMYKRIANLLGK